MHHCCLLSRTILPGEIGLPKMHPKQVQDPSVICKFKKRQETSKNPVFPCLSSFFHAISSMLCTFRMTSTMSPRRKGRREAGWTSAPWVVPPSSSSRSAARSRGNAAMASKITVRLNDPSGSKWDDKWDG